MGWKHTSWEYICYLRDICRIRGCGKCEFCETRFGSTLHHRHYRTYGGKEQPEDVMLVCDFCHSAIHGLAGFGVKVPAKVGSLVHLGDNGKSSLGGDDSIWENYLNKKKAS